MELKLKSLNALSSMISATFNQTRMELKLYHSLHHHQNQQAFNQTRMELKHEYLIFCVGGKVNF